MKASEVIIRTIATGAGIMLMIAGMDMSIRGIYKAIKSKYTDWDAPLLCWKAVLAVDIGFAICVLARSQIINV